MEAGFEKSSVRGSQVVRAFFAVILPLTVVACSNTSKPKPSASVPSDVLSIGSSQEVVAGVPLQRPQLQISQAGDEAVSQGSHAVGQSFAPQPSSVPSGNVISNQTKFSSKTYGVAGSPRVTTSTNVRKGGGRYQVGKPYTIRGRRYVPREDPNYRAVGLASWYGPNFHGRLTANGEVYDQFALSAAHPTMPLPSYAKVTNLENGSSLIVRVNDRGPFASKRIIDLSSKAAELLGYTKKGVAKVKVEYVGKARMDGLDHQYLVASYDPGSLQGTTAIASASSQPQVVASAQPVTPQAPKLAPQPSRQTLDAFDTTRFSTGNSVQDVSAFQAPKPSGLINGFAAETDGSDAVKAITASISGEPAGGQRLSMNDLAQAKVGPFQSKSAMFEWVEVLSQFGPVSVLEPDASGQYALMAVVAAEDVSRLRALFDEQDIQ